MPASETIVALSTAPGRSAISIIRLSGSQSLAVLRTLVADKDLSPEPNRVALRRIFEPTSGDLLDESLITYFKGPNSFTGEDIVEISCHGSPVLIRQIIDLTLSMNARLAGPGEFTLRAVANGRLKLEQAEAIRDLIDSQTSAAARQAARQMSGELSLRLQPLKDILVNIIVVLESTIEFVEEDLPEIAVAQLDEQLSYLMNEIRQLSGTYQEGRLLREGLKVALVGRPNVGKSSLFNSLLSADRAIVTDIEGTTRDSLTETISVKGVPVTVTDTAGLRASDNQIEKLGVQRTRRAMADADLVVFVLDGSMALTSEDFEILSEIKSSRHLIVVNKMDLQSFSSDEIRRLQTGEAIQEVSARNRSGLDALSDAILAPFATGETVETGLLITDARHFDLLKRAVKALDVSRELFSQGAGEELVLVGLNDALKFLGEITGETTSEDILSRIFATFCIGK